MAEAKCFDSISAIDRAQWNACFESELEDYDYYLALDRSNIKGFRLCYYALMESSTLLTAFPAFFTDYDLATTAEGAVRKWLLKVQKIFPRQLILKLACAGSFATESCGIAMKPGLTTQEQSQYLATLAAFFRQDARTRGTKLFAFKDVNDDDKARYDAVLTAQGFHCVTGMPSAVTSITFGNTGEYLATLSSSTRKNMRRKLKKQNDLRIVYSRDIEALLPEIHAMYLETKKRSDVQFEELTEEYFREVMRLPEAFYMLYYAGDRLIGANLLLENSERLLDKFFCMRTEEGQHYSLYFISWFENLRYCTERKLRYYQSGQAGYETKLRLGSRFLANWMYFHHCNPLVNRLLKLASPLLAFEVPVEKSYNHSR